MFGKLFGWLSGVDAQKTIDTVASGVDMLIYTDEEKSIAGQKIIDAKLQAISKQSIARRVIAVAVTLNFLLLLNIAVGLQVFNHVEQATFIFTVLRDTLLQPFSIIMGFYFLVQMVKK